MFKFLVFCLSLICLVRGNGEFVIIKSPKSIEFSGNEAIDGQDIPHVFSASLGFTVRKSSNWPGMRIKNPFGLADVVTVLAVDGVSSLGSFANLPTYSISPVDDESALWRSLQFDVLEHYPTMEYNNTLSRIELGSEVEKSDDTVEDVDYENVVQDLKEMTQIVTENAGLEGPRVNWFQMSSLHSLSDLKGVDDDFTVQAKKKVREALLEIGDILDKASNGRALVAAIITDDSHTRHIRAATDGNDTVKVPDNLAEVYTENYPAMFNIILWFMIVFIFSLIAISYTIATMDPGRDSIIYRMTSNRIKKDS